MVYLHNGLLFDHKKEQSTVMCYTWKNLENNILSERCQTQQTVYYIISFFILIFCCTHNLHCVHQEVEEEELLTALAPGAAAHTQSLPSKSQFHFHEMSRIGKSTETESRLVDTRGWGDGEIESNLTMWVSLGNN